MSLRKATGPVVGGFVLIAVALGAAIWGINSRARALEVVAKDTNESALPTVAIVKPERGEPSQEVVLPGSIQPFADAPIFARTNGYLRKWYFDIGSPVRAGQLLAEIDTPEVDQQLAQARADLATAQANARLAKTTADRYRDLAATDAVAKQDVDNALGNFEAREAAVASAQANVNRLEQLKGFARIISPFDGVVTARNVDIGALVDSGSNARELFHVAAVDRLRVFVNVPEVQANAAMVGLQADLTVAEFPARHFTGTLARTAQAIDAASRTLRAEIDVDNRHRDLLPGSYAQVHLKLPASVATVKIPANTLIFGAEGLRVGVVNEGRVTLVPVTLGRDFGDTVEVVAGLTGNEQIVLNPPDSLESGEAVQILRSE
jgi:RND family efflux transporter MFP subunit